MTAVVPLVNDGCHPRVISDTFLADWKRPTARSLSEYRWPSPGLAEPMQVPGTLYYTPEQVGPIADNGSPIPPEVLAPTHRGSSAPPAHEHAAQAGGKGWPTLPGYE